MSGKTITWSITLIRIEDDKYPGWWEWTAAGEDDEGELYDDESPHIWPTPIEARCAAERRLKDYAAENGNKAEFHAEETPPGDLDGRPTPHPGLA